MMKDTFLIFVCFILVFLLAFSITSWSLLSTNKQINWLYATNGSSNNFTLVSENRVQWSWQLLRDVFNWGIWKVFGQVAEPFKNNASDMDVISENDAYGTFVFLYAVAFVVISNVLLLNVLIAMFNKTIGDVFEKSTMIWRVFIKGIQFSTEKALQELKTKVNRGYDQQVEGFEEQTEGFKKQVEDFKNIKVKYSLYLAI
ncbi:unnamed protein product [Rotaria sordida]|uniref:Ion transport domain-containing protein n=1 Tax=Rotaria sordida TaxID=392033 RepID=A0A815BA13_9BILA|nr:unnamed protein product [Rotaria sordida]